MKMYLTEYRENGVLCGDDIEACDWQHAQSIADVRGRGETVIGEVVLKVESPSMTPEKADTMMRSLADEAAEFGRFEN